MNGPKAILWTKAGKMAFSRTAGGAARTSNGEGGRRRRGPCLTGRTPGTKARNMAGSRTLVCARRKAGSHAALAQASAAAGPPGQPAGSRTRWAQRPPARALPGPHSSRPARAARSSPTPSALCTHRETEARSDCVSSGTARGSLRLPAGISYLNRLGLALWRQRQLLSPTEPGTQPGSGRR